MKKVFMSFVIAILSLSPIFAQTVFVLDFETEIIDYEKNAISMSDMLRAEIVKTGKLKVSTIRKKFA